jgi:hypothetical protein
VHVPNQELNFQRHMKICHGLFCVQWFEVRWGEVRWGDCAVNCFIDIGATVDHHCLNYIFIKLVRKDMNIYILPLLFIYNTQKFFLVQHGYQIPISTGFNERLINTPTHRVLHNNSSNNKDDIVISSPNLDNFSCPSWVCIHGYTDNRILLVYQHISVGIHGRDYYIH